MSVREGLSGESFSPGDLCAVVSFLLSVCERYLRAGQEPDPLSVVGTRGHGPSTSVRGTEVQGVCHSPDFVGSKTETRPETL